MLNLKEILTDSYCMAIRNHFGNDSENEMRKLSVEKQELEMYRQLDQYQDEKDRVMREWADTPVEELDGATPSDLINNMGEFEDVFDLFLYMAENADDEVPQVLIERLKSFKGEAISALADIASSRMESQNTDVVFIAAVSALGNFKDTDAVQSLIDMAYKAGNSPELDHIEEALKNAGACTIEPILEALEGRKIGNVEKMLLYVLASVGANHKDDRIYQKLRLAFRTLEDKMPAVICFNVYGDGRAIPMLRGYLERNSKMEKALFYEIVGTIRNLGGITEEFLRLY
ncbi:MAG TPA: hypothetical protein VIL05_10865 [Thermoclostridium sp.]